MHTKSWREKPQRYLMGDWSTGRNKFQISLEEKALNVRQNNKNNKLTVNTVSLHLR
jgi:hypothetical protein